MNTQRVRHGGKHFHEELKLIASELMTWVIREQPTHREFLERRENIIKHKPQCFRSTARAKTEFFAYLEGAQSSLFKLDQIVWKHRSKSTGEWLSSPLPEGSSYDSIDIDHSRWVWADSNRVWFGTQEDYPGESCQTLPAP